MKKLVYHLLQSAWFAVGLFVMSAGIVLMVQAQFGPLPWEVFHLGLTNCLPLSLGQGMIATSLVVVIIAWLMGVKPYIGTVVNAISIGVIVDLIINWNWFPETAVLSSRIIYLIVGIILCNLGGAIYMSVNIGYGPRDSLMIALTRKTGLRIGITRAILEVTVVAIGWLMGGLFGIGTVISALVGGWIVEFFLHIFEKVKQSKGFVSFQNYMLDRGKSIALPKSCKHHA